MNLLRKRIETLVSGSDTGDRPLLDNVLLGASFLYGAGVKFKNFGYDYSVFREKKLPCRVVSIGNIVAGGTGKTPMAIYLATLLRQRGHRPVVLSRGYGGEAEKKGAVVSDGHRILCNCWVSGDEPFMMASRIRGVPVIVGGNRYKSGRDAVLEFDPDIILLDDGFQHRRLHRDLNLVLVDARKMHGNGHLLPRGPLREPACALRRSDAIILTRCTGENRLNGTHAGKPVFRTRHAAFVSGVYDGLTPLPDAIHAKEPTGTDFSLIEKASVFVFSGIAGSQEFLTSIKNNAKRVVGSMAFPDHHPYTDEELEQVAITAGTSRADYLVTTAKDYVRVAGRIPGEIPIVVVDVRIVFNNQDESAFIRFLANKLAL